MKRFQFLFLAICINSSFGLMATDKPLEINAPTEPVVQEQIVTTPNSQEACIICWNTPINPAILSCGHSFCPDCIYRWLKDNPTCPLCRSNQKSYKPTFACAQCKKTCRLSQVGKSKEAAGQTGISSRSVSCTKCSQTLVKKLVAKLPSGRNAAFLWGTLIPAYTAFVNNTRVTLMARLLRLAVYPTAYLESLFLASDSVLGQYATFGRLLGTHLFSGALWQNQAAEGTFLVANNLANCTTEEKKQNSYAFYAGQGAGLLLGNVCAHLVKQLRA